MPIVIKWIVFILILQKIQIIYTTVFVVLTFIQWEDVKNDKYLGIFSYFIMELYVVCTH